MALIYILEIVGAIGTIAVALLVGMLVTRYQVRRENDRLDEVADMANMKAISELNDSVLVRVRDEMDRREKLHLAERKALEARIDALLTRVRHLEEENERMRLANGTAL